jgi:hypothetical protein
VPRKSAEAIRIVLAGLGDRQRSLVQESLEQANVVNGAESRDLRFEFDTVLGRGIQILERAAQADVVVFGAEEGLPGEASHLLAEYPDVKVIVVDDDAHVRVVLGAVTEPLSRDLPTVIRWITRRNEDRAPNHSRAD